MPVNIGPRIGIDGEAQFRKELNNIIQQAKTLSSEMKAVTSAFDSRALRRSQEKRSAQASVLNKQIELQKTRVEQLRQGLAQIYCQIREADSKTQKWAQAVNEATADLNKMKRQLSGLDSDVEDASDSFDDMSDSNG